MRAEFELAPPESRAGRATTPRPPIATSRNPFRIHFDRGGSLSPGKTPAVSVYAAGPVVAFTN